MRPLVAFSDETAFEMIHIHTKLWGANEVKFTFRLIHGLPNRSPDYDESLEIRTSLDSTSRFK